MRFNEILEGTRADIAVKVFGEDYAEIERIAGEVREILEKVPGAADVEFDALGKAPMLEIALKREAMTRYNLHASEVNASSPPPWPGRGRRADGRQPPLPIVVRLPEASAPRLDVS
jgi:cobalt-zinc-cadmium resistance protein CzcA